GGGEGERGVGVAGLGHELSALGDRRLDAHQSILEQAGAGDVHEEERAVALADDPAVLGLQAYAAHVLDGRVVDTAAQEHAAPGENHQRQSQRGCRQPGGAKSAGGAKSPGGVKSAEGATLRALCHAPLNAPSAAIAAKARSYACTVRSRSSLEWTAEIHP